MRLTLFTFVFLSIVASAIINKGVAEIYTGSRRKLQDTDKSKVITTAAPVVSDETIYRKLRTSQVLAAVRQNEEGNVYTEAMFITAYLLKHPEHGYDVAEPEVADTIGDLIGHLGVAIKHGIPIDQSVTDKCLKEGKVEFKPDVTELLNKEFELVKSKYSINDNFKIPPYHNVTDEFLVLVNDYRQSFYKMGRTEDKVEKFNNNSISKKDMLYIVQLLAVAMNQAKYVILSEQQLEGLQKHICDEIKLVVDVVGENGSVFGPLLLQKLLEKVEGAASSGYLVAVPLQAAVIGYLLLYS